MIIPVLNMDVTPAVQLMIVISYIALVYGLSVEIIGGHPFGRTIKPKAVNVKIENPATETATKQRKTISRKGRFLTIKDVCEYFEGKGNKSSSIKRDPHQAYRCLLTTIG